MSLMSFFDQKGSFAAREQGHMTKERCLIEDVLWREFKFCELFDFTTNNKQTPCSLIRIAIQQIIQRIILEMDLTMPLGTFKHCVFSFINKMKSEDPEKNMTAITREIPFPMNLKENLDQDALREAVTMYYIFCKSLKIELPRETLFRLAVIVLDRRWNNTQIEINIAQFMREIKHEGNEDFGRVLIAAACSGQEKIVVQLLKDPRMGEINHNGDWGIGRALCGAARSGQEKIVVQLLKDPLMGEINHNGDRGIGRVLIAAACSGQEKIVVQLLKDPLMGEINRNEDMGIGRALCVAAEYGHVEIMTLLLEDTRMGEINHNGDWGIGRALCVAAQNGHVGIVTLLLKDPRMGEINHNGKRGIGHALCVAAQNGHSAIVAQLLQNKFMRDVNYYSGEWNICKAIQLAKHLSERTAILVWQTTKVTVHQ